MNVYQALRYWQFCRPSGGDSSDEFVGVAIRSAWPDLYACGVTFQPGAKGISAAMTLWLDIDRIIKNQPMRVKRLVFMWVRGKINNLPMPVLRHLQKQFNAL